MEATQELTFLSVLLPVIVIIFIIAVGVFLLNQHFQRNLFKQKLQQEELKNSQQKELLKSSIQVQEAERKRIARDLHDELGATLSIARMQLVKLEQATDVHDIISELTKIRTITESALTSVRQISHELMPPQLAKFGLPKTLQSVADNINDAGKFRIWLDCDEEASMISSEVALGLYRICMELIQNTLKHANADNANIKVEFDEHQQIKLSYSDDGRGFKLGKETNGLGLKSLAARANSMGGTFRVLDGDGFSAQVIIPLLTT
jgi:signal transduction histidine kinase